MIVDTRSPLTVTQRDLRLLGLFPYFGLDAIGGVQLSGRLAWEGLCTAMTPHGGSTHLFDYGAPAHALSQVPINGTRVTLSKVQAIRAALRVRIRPNLVFIWHIGLLRLLPLFRISQAKVALVLLGIEAWHRHDPLTHLLLQRINLFLSISDHTWNCFLKIYPNLATRPHQTIHLGLDVPGPSVATPRGTPTALILGRLARGEDYKGHRELIDAWPIVLQHLPDAELWVAGDGDLRSDLERMVQARDLEGHIRFFGQVLEEQKDDLLARCRCLAMPSRGEGFGLVYLEAMRQGRPCLVSTLDAGREVVNPPEAGLAADPSDRQALAAALCRLMTAGTEWDRWSDQARRRYESRFTARHFQERLVKAIFE